jgi:hypothetical protein
MPTTKQAENTASRAQRAKATNAGLIELQIEYRSVTDIVLDPRNPRQHSQLQINQIADSIREFGFYAPVVTDHAGHFKSGAGRHTNNVELGKHGCNRTNVWNYDSASVEARKGNNLLALHPTGKPVHLVMDALLDCSRRGDIVLDSFLGSGTTLLAAERTGRIFRGIELDPLYIDTAIRRWQNLTGHDAVRAADGRLFREIEAEKEDADER